MLGALSSDVTTKMLHQLPVPSSGPPWLSTSLSCAHAAPCWEPSAWQGCRALWSWGWRSLISFPESTVLCAGKHMCYVRESEVVWLQPSSRKNTCQSFQRWAVFLLPVRSLLCCHTSLGSWPRGSCPLEALGGNSSSAPCETWDPVRKLDLSRP